MMFSTVVLGTTVWMEYETTDMLLEFEERFALQGGYVATASSPDGIDANRCESLSEVDGVIGAGSVSSSISSETTGSPGTRFQLAYVTVGIFDVWLPNTPPSDFEIAAAIVAGTAAANELGVGEGSLVGLSTGRPLRVGAVADTSQRNPAAMRWLMLPVPATGRQSECWAEFTPAAFDAGVELLWATFAGTDKEVIVRPYRELDEFSVDPADALTRRSHRNMWVLAGLALSLFFSGSLWFRRSEFALYRAIGTSSFELTVMVWLEAFIVAVVGTAASVVWSTALHAATSERPLDAGQMIIGLRSAASAAFLFIAIAPIAVLFGRQHDIASQLKDR